MLEVRRREEEEGENGVGGGWRVVSLGVKMWHYGRQICSHELSFLDVDKCVLLLRILCNSCVTFIH